MAEEEDTGPKPNQANADDEFLRHPGTGAFFRNPLKESTEKPIIMSQGEYEHNMLDNALSTWNCVSIDEKVFRKMTLGRQPDAIPEDEPAPAIDVKQKAALRRLDRITGAYEYVITVRKSQYVAPRGHRRHAAPLNPAALQIEKLAVDLLPEPDINRPLRVENIGDGLVAMWNRANPFFAVRAGDYLTKVEGVRGNAQSLIDALNSAEDQLKITFRRVRDRTASKMSVYSTDPVAEMTMQPGGLST